MAYVRRADRNTRNPLNVINPNDAITIDEPSQAS